MQYVENTELACNRQQSEDQEQITSISLPGEYTILGLRALCKGLAQKYRDLFKANPKQVISCTPEVLIDAPREEVEDVLGVQAIVASFSGSDPTFYADDRNRPDYSAAVPHVHPGTITTSLCTESGETPTLFLRDHELFMDRLSELGILTFLEQKTERWQHAVPRYLPQAQSAAQAMFIVCQDQQTIRRSLEDDIRVLKGTSGLFHSVKPEKGRILLFGPEAIHAAGNAVSYGNNGSLFVTNWKA